MTKRDFSVLRHLSFAIQQEEPWTLCLTSLSQMFMFLWETLLRKPHQVQPSPPPPSSKNILFSTFPLFFPPQDSLLQLSSRSEGKLIYLACLAFSVPNPPSKRDVREMFSPCLYGVLCHSQLFLSFRALQQYSLLFKCLSHLPHPVPLLRPLPLPTSLLPPLPSPSPNAQPVRGSGYCGHAHFSIMSSSACRKRKPLVQPETPEHSTRDSSLSSALHFLNEIPLPLLTQRGGRSVAAEKNTSFSFSLQSVRELKGGAFGSRESGYSEDACLPFGHFVLELAARSQEHLILKVFVFGTNGPKFL